MGNCPSCHAVAVAKVVLSDGTVRLLEAPISVAELMLDHPGEAVFQLLHGRQAGGPGNDSRTVGRKRTSAPLPADHKVEAGKEYVMMQLRKPSAKGLLTAAATRRVHPAVDAEGEGVCPPAMTPGMLRLTSRRWRPTLATISERAAAAAVAGKSGTMPYWVY